MADFPLQGQAAIVTGASQGIGAAIARRLAGLGARVVLVARTQSKLQELARELGEAQALVCPADLRQPGEIQKLAEFAWERMGRIDLLVNNAGVGVFHRPLHETPEADWDCVLETNLRAVYLLMRAAVPRMIAQGGGQIVNIASLAGYNPVPYAAAYAATKWGLRGLTLSAAEELRAQGIRVSLVSPGSVNTHFSPASASASNKDPNRMLQPDDVAHIVAMLATQAPGSFASEVLVRPTVKP